MKAFVSRAPGLENAVYDEVPNPVAGERQVVVQLEASSLNHLDLWVAKGHPSYKVEYPHVLGSDGAGVVEYAGPDSNVRVGERVVILPLLYCSQCDACKSNLVGSCDNTGTIGAQTWGTHAEFVVVPEKNVYSIKTLSFEKAAAIPVGALTAYHMLHSAGVKKGDTVLVWGAASSVGSFGIQIAKYFGASVVTTASTEKIEEASKIFGVPVIDYKKEDVGQAVREITRGKGVDIVMEIVGPSTWSASCASVKKGGCIVTCGAVSGPEVVIPLRWLYSNQVRIQGCKQGTPEEFQEVLGLAEKGVIKPVIEYTYPLSQASEAFSLLAEGKGFGKIVLTR